MNKDHLSKFSIIVVSRPAVHSTTTPVWPIQPYSMCLCTANVVADVGLARQLIVYFNLSLFIEVIIVAPLEQLVAKFC